MIEGDEVMAHLARACPSWAARNPVAAAAPLEGPRDYEPIGAFAHHLVALVEEADTAELPAVFVAVEEVLRDGDDDAVALIRTGLVEDLQNITSHRDVHADAADFRRFAGPLTATVWDEIDEAWSAATTVPGSAGHRPSADEFLGLPPIERRRIQSMTRELPDGTLAGPSDVLRFEADRYDEELDRWLRSARAGRLVYVAGVLLVVLVVWIFVVR